MQLRTQLQTLVVWSLCIWHAQASTSLSSLNTEISLDESSSATLSTSRSISSLTGSNEPLSVTNSSEVSSLSLNELSSLSSNESSTTSQLSSLSTPNQLLSSTTPSQLSSHITPVSSPCTPISCPDHLQPLCISNTCQLATSHNIFRHSTSAAHSSASPSHLSTPLASPLATPLAPPLPEEKASSTSPDASDGATLVSFTTTTSLMDEEQQRIVIMSSLSSVVNGASYDDQDTDEFARLEEPGTEDSHASEASAHLPSDDDVAEPDQSANSTVDSVDDSIEDCHFMSFEEWKRQKSYNDQDTTKKNATGMPSGTNETNKLDPQTESNLTELVPFDHQSSHDNKQQQQQQPPHEQHVDLEHGKLYKDKFNYASIDCAATVVKTNNNAKGASSILTENKDSYLLNQCSDPNKFVIIELCQDILVNSVVVGNFEFFSSMFHHIRVSVSDRFPVAPPNNWKVLGEFEAQNIRDVQIFTIENPLIWARYMKLEILSHYGDEFYCPISIVRVHGTTMIQEFKLAEEEEEAAGKLINDFKLQSEELVDINTDDAGNSTSSFNGSQEDDELYNECRVTLPHLGLNEFLNDINSTSDWCVASSDFNDFHSSAASAINSTNANAGASSSSSSSPTAPTIKTTQESIYKNIMKRLSLLESNATLSLLYIEEQSKLLSTAFTNLERRQANRLDSLVNSFNKSMTHQLSHFKRAYTSIQNDAIGLFKLQERNHQTLMNDANKRLALLTDDLKFQRKVSIFNTLIILCLLIYVVITRDAYIDQSFYYEDLEDDGKEEGEDEAPEKGDESATDRASSQADTNGSVDERNSHKHLTSQVVKDESEAAHKKHPYPVGFSSKLSRFNHDINHNIKRVKHPKPKKVRATSTSTQTR